MRFLSLPFTLLSLMACSAGLRAQTACGDVVGSIAINAALPSDARPAVANGFAFVPAFVDNMNDSPALMVIDVRVPEAPVVTQVVDLPTVECLSVVAPSSVAVSGTEVYVVNPYAGVRVYTHDGMGSLTLVAVHTRGVIYDCQPNVGGSQSASVGRVEVSPAFLLAAIYDSRAPSRVLIMDRQRLRTPPILPPGNPQSPVVASIGIQSDFAARGGLLAAGVQSGVNVFALNGASGVSFLNTLSLPGPAKTLDFDSDGSLYVAEGNDRLYRTASPTTACCFALIGSTSTIRNGTVTVSDGLLAWSSITSAGVGLYDVRGPQAEFIASARTPTRGTTLDGGFGYAASGDFTVYRVADCLPSIACSDADLAAPLGVLDIDDVLTFLTAFSTGDAFADIAPPTGALDIDDVLTFLSAFAAGCP